MDKTRHWVARKGQLAVAFIILIALPASLAAQPEIAAKFIARSHTYQGVTIPYRLFIPDGYTAAKRYPLVLALHGSGEQGTDNGIQLSNNHLATAWATPTNQSRNPCFVVAPQCRLGESWSWDGFTLTPPSAAANNIVDSLIREFAIDTNRLYVTGLSDGAWGTFALASTYPDRFAAAIPVSGAVNDSVISAAASRLLSVPIWDLHGALDPLVHPPFSRRIIDTLHARGRPVVYTHCNNRDCSGLPDSVISMLVQSHQNFFYTEFPAGGHDVPFFNWAYEYPFLADWVFDQSRQRPGAVKLTSLQSHVMVSGFFPVSWSTSTSAGDIAELWFSPDAGSSWQLITRSAPNTGSFLWNTASVGDCAFGRLALFLKDTAGHLYARDQSAFFSVNNTHQGAPFVKILNEEFTTSTVFDTDSLTLRLLIGDPTGAPLRAAFWYSADGGVSFARFDSSAAAADSAAQMRTIRVGPLANSDEAVVRVAVSNGPLTAAAQTSPFFKRTPRLAGPKAAHAGGPSAASVTVHIVDPGALTGHRYRVNFNDSTGLQKSYAVRDLDRGFELIRGATELDGVTEGPLFDGIRLVVSDLPSARLNVDSTRWVTGKSTLHVQVSAQVRDFGSGEVASYAAPCDYRLTVSSTVVDTSKTAYVFTATPIKFQVWNLTKNRKTDVLFYDVDGNNAISPFDEVDLLEPDSLGQPRLSWSMLFVPDTALVLPAAGDLFELKTLKPLTSADAYEFTGALTSVATRSTPGRFILEQNYPNPFNPATVIQFQLPEARTVHLQVFDLLGRHVATLVDGLVTAGVHRITFNAGRLATGVYFYRLEAGGFTAVKRLMVLK